VEVILGGLSSILYGFADFFGGQGAKRAPAAAVVLWAGVLSFPLILAVALIIGGEADRSDYLLGAMAGTAGAVGLVSLFAGLGRGQAAAVAPTAAAVAAILPVVVAVIGGERPSLLAWVGVVIAIPAIVLSAWVADPGESLRGSVGYGLVAGLGFGGFTALIGLTDPDSSLLPLISSRGSTMAVVLVLAAFGVWKLVGFGSSPRLLVAGNAVLDVSGNVALLLAVRAGSLALAAVAASFYPAVTVLLARLVNGEHLRARQFVGIGLTVMAMSVIALS
jgi:drug/metabolite transporter (DMT)-like permease